MTATDERHAIAELAELGGWERRDVDRTDHYARGIIRVQVLWRGDEAISGSSLYQDDIMTAYTRDLNTLQGWLKR
jgi:hypothetical protein